MGSFFLLDVNEVVADNNSNIKK